MRKFTILTSMVGCALLFIQFKTDKAPLKIFPKNLRENFAWVPGGIAVIGKDTSKIVAFYIAKTEVSQAEYDKFLSALRTEGDNTKIQIAVPDSLAWNSIGNNMSPYTTYYHSHPAYKNYPVVNVRYEAALMYCEWFAKELENQMGGQFEVTASLPDRMEWIRAARGDKHAYKYTWGGPSLRNAKGTVLCNYSSLGDEAIRRNPVTNEFEIMRGEGGSMLGVAGYLSDNADILAPVNTYSPNDFGLYNVNGNAREMISEKGQSVGGSWRDPGYDVRNESISMFEGPSPDLGFRPIFRVVKK
ncbi:MAG: formylglycine-generating enzyme family protein [Flavobacteriales bacterium]